MRRWTALILVLLAGGGALSQAQPSTSAADDPQTAHTPTLLWKNFPLRQQTAPRSESRVRSQPHGRRDRSRSWLWVLIATTVALSATASAVASFVRHSRRRRRHMDRFRLARGDREANDESPQEQEPIGELERGAERVMGYLSASEASSPDSGYLPGVTAHESGSERFGEYAGSVLSAAKAAAVRIEEEARHEAKRVRDLAHKKATEQLDAARVEANTTRAEAERLRLEAENWNKQTRMAAESSAAGRRATADAAANDTRSAAEREAASFSENTQRRRQALEMDISLAEDRLRQLATGIRELAGGLDALLSTPVHGQQGAVALTDENSRVDAPGPAREAAEATM
jgi:hypothetical protein